MNFWFGQLDLVYLENKNDKYNLCYAAFSHFRKLLLRGLVFSNG